MTPTPNESHDRPQIERKRDKSATWWASPIRHLIAEGKTLPGKLNLSTVLILAGMAIMSFLGFLAEFVFELKLSGDFGSFSMGGDPAPIGIATFAFILLWLAVTQFCMKTYLETK